MMRRMKIFVICLFLSINSIKSESIKNDGKPNIILMLMDDMGWGDLGRNGNPVKETPNLDRMADEGLVFENFYSASPLCSPSRASLLTGRLPIRNGFYTTNQKARNSLTLQEVVGGISKSEILISELLKKAGYRNKIVGKWHLGHSKFDYHPTNNGFHEFYGSPNCHFGPYNNLEIPNIPVFRDENMIGRYFENIEIDRERQVSNLTQIYTDEALNFIRKESANGKPFFLYWTPDSLHAPTFRSEKYVGKSLKGSSYGDTLIEIDDSVGRILDEVRQNKNLSSNTLVFFSSDNGAALVSKDDAGSSGPFLCGKQTTFEGGFREPAIAWWPGKIKAKRSSYHLTTTMDLFATFSNLAGIKIPKDRVLDSEDLSPIMFQQTSSPLLSISLTQGQKKGIFFYRGDTLMALRVGPYKAHFWTFTNPQEELNRGIDFCPGNFLANITTPELTKQKTPILFHLERDPGERYPIGAWTLEYKNAMERVLEILMDHQQNLKPGKPVLNICDNASMNWRPNGCEKIGMCLEAPRSLPYRCDWPH